MPFFLPLPRLWMLCVYATPKVLIVTCIRRLSRIRIDFTTIVQLLLIFDKKLKLKIEFGLFAFTFRSHFVFVCFINLNSFLLFSVATFAFGFSFVYNFALLILFSFLLLAFCYPIVFSNCFLCLSKW